MHTDTLEYFRREYGGVPGTTGQALTVLAKFANYKGKSLAGLRSKLVKMNKADTVKTPWKIIAAFDSLRNSVFRCPREIRSDFMDKIEANAVKECIQAVTLSHHLQAAKRGK